MLQEDVADVVNLPLLHTQYLCMSILQQVLLLTMLLLTKMHRTDVHTYTMQEYLGQLATAFSDQA